MSLRCESPGCRRRARWACLDEPEQDSATLGDELLGLVLCTRCLDLAEADGPWTLVARLDWPRQEAVRP